MKQVGRRLRDGRLELVEVPEPAPMPGAVLVRTAASVISTGTERARLEVARKSLLGKARARPDQAKQVIDRVRSEGAAATVELVRRRLDELEALGYSAAGTAVSVGSGVEGIRPGNRVAIAGAGFANHAELDLVPARLCAPVPDGVELDAAAFATIGAIAMQGFRRAEVGVGSRIAVIGLGLIGQLSVRIARAAGCEVVGVDLDAAALELARGSGAEALARDSLDPGGRVDGSVDAVLICASAPQSSDPVELAAQLCRDRGTVVVVGDVGIDVPRQPYYDKELDLRLSRSYGPGRYDPDYELHGHDYPIGQVRWTEQRNMESFLALIASGGLGVSDLISHRFDFDDAERAFEVLTGPERTLAILLEYPQADPSAAPQPTAAKSPSGAPAAAWAPLERTPRAGIIGAGKFATGTLMPGLREAGFELAAITSAGGLSAEDARRRFDIARAVGDVGEVIGNGEIDLVAIATRHDQHAELTAAALTAGQATYVEKPLALDSAGLAAVRDAQAATGAPLFVGFNRRHAPIIAELSGLQGPKLISYRVNAGRLPADHWTNDPARGGGRLLGEGCHFVDLICALVDADPVTVLASGFASIDSLPLIATDNFNLRIEFADGSVGSVNYAADAPRGPGKERIELSAPGAYAEVEDFRRGSIWRGSKRERIGSARSDKGFAAQYAAFLAVLSGSQPYPGPEAPLVSTLVSLAALRSLQSGRPEAVIENG